MRFARQRLLGPADPVFRLFWPIFVAIAFVGWVTYGWVSEERPDLAAGVTIASFVLLALLVTTTNPLVAAMLNSAWQRRGRLDPNPTIYRIDDDGLVCETPLYEHKLNWAGISEISRSGRTWIILAPGLIYYLPRRLFADGDEERSFIAACRHKLSPEARVRCRD